jgi:hypothetical protein
MTMTEREKFMARLAKARDAGLVDMKFFFHPARPMKPEEIFAAMNEVEDAAQKGVRHSEWERARRTSGLEKHYKYATNRRPFGRLFLFCGFVCLRPLSVFGMKSSRKQAMAK